MSIRDRLRRSYGAMVIIPIVVSIIAAFFISQIYIREIEKVYNIQVNQRPLGDIIEEESQLIEKLKGLTQDDTEEIDSIDELQAVNVVLRDINAGILIRRNNSIIFSSEILKSVEIEDRLPRFGGFTEEIHGKLSVNGHPYLVRQLDFHYDDGSRGSVFLIVDLSFVEKTFKGFIITLLLVIVLIIILTNGILTLYVSRSILNPLKELENATNEIKEGNLDFAINCNSKDEIGQLCYAFEDMRHKLKESIEIQLQYERNRNELMTNISHDLKTPVTAIKGYVEGIMDGVADSPEKRERYIKTIYNKSKEMDRLIDELLLFSKLDINKIPFHFEEVNIQQFLKDITEEYQFDLEGKNISLELYCEIDDLPLVLADREKLKRVIGNVVDNAVKYMKKDPGRIEVIVSKNNGKDEAVQVEIRDNGQGIPQEHLPFIFDRFYRADASRNMDTGGNGLGLAIAKRILQEHGGEIWGESQLNKGTSIFFTLRKYTEGNRGEGFEKDFDY